MRDKPKEEKQPTTTNVAPLGKVIAARLRSIRAKQSGSTAHVAQSRKRRPNEDTVSRNQRIVERYEEILRLNGGRQWGVMTQLQHEFCVTRQYISAKVIYPYLAQKK